MNPRLRKEYKHYKNLCLSKEMDLIFLLKQFEMRIKHSGLYPELPTCVPYFQFPWVSETLDFPKSQRLFAIYESTERFLMWPFDSWGAQLRALNWGFLWHVQQWADEILPPSQHSGGLVQTWHGWPRASTRLDNKNIQQFICLRLYSFVLYITTFFSIRRILSYDLSLSIRLLLMKWHQKV